MAFFTNRAADEVAAPKVHDTVIDVAETTVAAPHVPSAVAVTEAPAANPLPVRVKAVVPFAEALAGDVAETVGPGWMINHTVFVVELAMSPASAPELIVIPYPI